MAKRMILPMVLLLCTNALGMEEKEITVKLTVPDATWSIAIDAVYEVGDELWVVSIVSHNPDMAGVQMISTVQASLTIAAPDLPVKNFIVGKTWNWKNEEPYTFIEGLKQIHDEIQSGKLLYQAAKAGP
jgi:zinc protease